MAITRTAKGTAQSKADTASLAVNDVEIDGGASILVGIIFFASANNPEIKWGNKKLTRDKTNEHSTAAFRAQLYRGRVRTTRQRNVVATWGTSTPGARAMFVVQTQEASHEDISVVNDNNNSTTPNTSSAGTSTVADTISIACFGSNGPSTDTVGTAGLGHTLGQRVGTSGGGDTTNLTIQETFEILSATGTIRASLSGVTARDWANLIVAYSATQTFTVGTTYYQPHDGFPGSESIHFRMEDESGIERFDITIPREEFEDMTDAEVEDRIRQECVRWAAKQIDGELSPDFDADATFDTRVSSFENDTFKV